MNLTEFIKEDNATFETDSNNEMVTIMAFRRVFGHVCLALGLPGNILSAIVWLRLHRKNSSAVYLAAIAVNDIVYLLSLFTLNISNTGGKWFDYCVLYLLESTGTIEPLLILGFSVERLLAICWPLQVCFCCMPSI